MKRLIPIFILFTCFFQLNAQYVNMDMPLVKDGNPLRNPWAGGFNLPQFSEVDLNNDGIKDLAVFDRDGRIATTFINNGTAGQVDYDYAPEYMKRLPKDVVNFMLFRDYNCDGIEDIFGMISVYGQGVGVAIWEGSYDANDTIQYTIKKNQVRYLEPGQANSYKMFIYNTDLPAIDDIDGDGDMDIMAFTLDICFSKNVFWYKNMSAENGHGCDSLEFVIQTKCWGMFEETGDSSKVNFGPSIDSCYNNNWFNQKLVDRPRVELEAERNARHIGANTTSVDYNGDGVKDLIMGGVTYKNANMVTGVLINDTILITSQDYHYPVYDEPIDIYTFPSMYFLDVDNDGKTDMLAAPSEMGPSESIKDSVGWFYKNTGTNSNMVFDFQQKDFLVGDMLDIGERAFPVLFDYNGDGLNDILLGSYGNCLDGGANEYGMTLLENIGSLSAPSFEYVTKDYGMFDTLGMNGLHPTLGDLDGDGDQDMICGAENGTLYFIQNSGGAGNVAKWKKPKANFSSINVTRGSSPFLVDLDRDNDLDLVVGTYAGPIHYFENTGTASNYNFSSTPTSTNLGGYSTQPFGSRYTMPLVYDNNGSYEMFIGHEFGRFIHLGNIDGNVLGVYDTLSENYMDFYEGRYADMAIADLDNDSKPEFLLGTGKGGLVIMTEKDTITNTPKVELESIVLRVFPNPANDELMISLFESNRTSMDLTIYNALGQRMVQQRRNEQAPQHQLDVSKLPAGLHFLEIRIGDYKEVLSFIKR